MPKLTSAIYHYIVRDPGGCGTITMRLQAGTTAEEARAIASTLQARVKGLCHLEASGDEAT